MTRGASGPISIAIAPAPPVGLATPLGYTAISEQITIPYLPKLNYVIRAYYDYHHKPKTAPS